MAAEVELEDLRIDMYDMPVVDPSTLVRFGANLSGELNYLSGVDFMY